MSRVIPLLLTARGDDSRFSDIDIAILTSATPKQWQQILDIIYQADTLLAIDCVRYDTLSNSSDLKHNIDDEGIVLYDSKT